MIRGRSGHPNDLSRAQGSALARNGRFHREGAISSACRLAIIYLYIANFYVYGFACDSDSSCFTLSNGQAALNGITHDHVGYNESLVSDSSWVI